MGKASKAFAIFLTLIIKKKLSFYGEISRGSVQFVSLPKETRVFETNLQLVDFSHNLLYDCIPVEPSLMF